MDPATLVVESVAAPCLGSVIEVFVLLLVGAAGVFLASAFFPSLFFASPFLASAAAFLAAFASALSGLSPRRFC